MDGEPHTGDGAISMVSSVICNRQIVGLALVAAVTLGISAGVRRLLSRWCSGTCLWRQQVLASSSQEPTLSTGTNLRRGSIFIFLVVSACLVVVASKVAVEDREGAIDPR